MRTRENRRRLTLPAHLVLGNGNVIDVTLLDLSSHGCRAEVATYLFPGDRVTLSIPGKGTVGCTVRWCRRSMVGLEFDPDENDRKEMVPRAQVRIPSGGAVLLRRIGRPNFQVNLIDISVDGCRLEVIERPNPGEQMQLTFPGLATVAAQVKWVEGFVAGMAFDRPFHPAVFDMLVERLTG